MCKYHPLYCIVPPHMLREIAQRGTEQQQAWARRNLDLGGRARGQREATFIASAAPEVAGGLLRHVYTANNSTNLPGTLVRSEGDPANSDPAVNEAYDGAGETYGLYKDVYQRNSINNNGMSLESTVHYDKSMDNAFWNGQQMVYGDGDEDLPADQRIFNRFTIAVDVIGHELTHGVTQYEANLAYSFQPGALNESISDVFGSLVKQYKLKQQASQADWIIGEGLLTDNVNGVGLRSMKAPGTAYDDPVLGKDPQPDNMSGYQVYSYDNGGVHINSGIPNKAFYETAIGIGGYAWEKAGQIWYVALRDKLGVNSNFQDAANQTFAVAGTLYGQDSPEQQAVRNGWAAVGITVDTSTPTPTNGTGCIPTLARILGLS